MLLPLATAKDRRTPGSFIGSETILDQLKNGPPRRRVGLIAQGPPAREGALIFDAQGEEELGMVTSGIPSPTLGKNVSMAL
jgi:aminomethyltransferase